LVAKASGYVTDVHKIDNTNQLIPLVVQHALSPRVTLYH